MHANALSVLAGATQLFGAALGVGSAIAGYNIGAAYYGGLVLVLPCFYLSLRLSSKARRLRLLDTTRSRWGMPKEEDRDLRTIRRYFDRTREETSRPTAVIDEQTWSDLDMDAVYTRIDRTFSRIGECVLYRMLRSPTGDGEELRERNDTVERIRRDSRLRDSLDEALLGLGRPSGHGLLSLLWEALPSRGAVRHVYSALAALALISLAVPAVLNAASLLIVPFGVFCVNVLVHYLTRRKFAHLIPAVTELSSLLRSGREILSRPVPGIETHRARIEPCVSATKRIASRTRLLLRSSGALGFDLTEIFYEYAKLFFLIEIRSFHAIIQEINRSIEQLRRLYHLVGELDALQSVASYRHSLSSYSTPEFLESGLHLEIHDAVHPLLDEPVPNSLVLDGRGTILTGSNMAGKSTFLRTLGINVLLAETLFMSLCSRYRCSFFRLLSSISTTDTLLEGKSRYYAESERLLEIIGESEVDPPLFCLIDEVLSGTNTAERSRASFAILEHLSHRNVLAVVATHDTALADMLDGAYTNHHFSDRLGPTGLEFDYSLKPGRATTTNAIRLLEYLGYPVEITVKARSPHRPVR